MKRNWKLIRAILRSEDTNAWHDYIVTEHVALCADAGYIRAHVIRGVDSTRIQVARLGHQLLTPSGYEAADALANSEDLDAVLAELDAKGVGQASDFVFAMMRKRAEDRLKK